MFHSFLCAYIYCIAVDRQVHRGEDAADLLRLPVVPGRADHLRGGLRDLRGGVGLRDI